MRVSKLLVPLSFLVASTSCGTKVALPPIDTFDDVAAWTPHPADGVELSIATEPGDRGGCMRLDFDFRTGAGYAVSRRAVDLTLPEDYVIRFRLRGEAPVNHLEFKLVDDSGENVWWSVRRDFEFTPEWQTVKIKKRHVSFAWGPQGGGEPTHIAALEIVVTAGNGGAGTVWIDDLELIEVPPVTTPPPVPVATASSALTPASAALDGDAATAWSPRAEDVTPWIQIDLGRQREFGGLTLDWNGDAVPSNYQVRLSDDGETWTTVWSARGSNGGRDHVYAPESDARYIRVDWRGGLPRGVPRAISALARRMESLAEVQLQPLEWSASHNAFFEELTAEAPRGAYPRSLQREQSYWTVVGADGDTETALMSEDGAVELGPLRAALEPFLIVDDEVISWADVSATQNLMEGNLPIPTVEWTGDGWRLEITAVAAGIAPETWLALRYRLHASESLRRRAALVLALRPFQVNPPSQTLNQSGGFVPLHEIGVNEGGHIIVGGVQALTALSLPSAVGVSSFVGGDAVAEHLFAGRWPEATSLRDDFGGASALLRFDLEESGEVVLAAPLTSSRLDPVGDEPGAWFERTLASTVESWHEVSSPIEVQLPPPAQQLWDLALSQLHYVLVNRAGVAIQPGVRSYARSWIRDGSLTSSALLRMGMEAPARDFLTWFAPNQFDNGKIPCVVDSRGPDPVPEHDSSGQFVFLVAEVLRYTGDRDLAESMWPRVIAAVDYLEGLIEQRRTPEFEDQREFFGILPPSISHEGYSAKPMHSYWDDLFALRGFRDAAYLAEELGYVDELPRLVALRDRFEHDLRNSIEAAMARHGIDYIPGCADLGDFDPTSTTILLSPVGAGDWIPREWITRTFERYWDFFTHRRDTEEWEALTPYELRNIGAFVQLGWRERAAEVSDWFLTQRKPLGWMQWAEVVKRDGRTPFFLGDLPHTWVGTDFVRSVLDMFLYYREQDERLVLGAGILPSWLESGETLAMRGLPTAFGSFDFEVQTVAEGWRVRVDGRGELPPGGMEIALGDASSYPRVESLPAEILIER